MANSYRAGIIGLGFIGAADQVSGDALGQRVEDLDGTHWAALDGHPQVSVVAGSSRDEGRRERFVARTGARTYADWRELIAREELDIVSVATYTPVHEEQTIACVEAGIRAIYCEKPVAPRLPAGERMVEACAEAGALLVFNHQRRFTSNYRRLRDHIAEGGLGELISVNAQWGSGRLGNVGTHVFDAICMLTGRRVEAVSATLDTAGKPDCRGSDFADPGGWGTMRLEGGLMVTVDAADYSRTPWDIRINGSEGRVFAGGVNLDIEYWDGRSEHWSNEDQVGSGMDVAVGEIVAWLDEGKALDYAPEEGVHVLEAIAAFHASHARNSAWVDLPLMGADRQIEVRSG
jgi:predicted dehydrogenase